VTRLTSCSSRTPGRSKFDELQARDRLARLAPGASGKAKAEAQLAVDEATARTAESTQRVAEAQKAVDDATPGSVANRKAIKQAERDVEAARRGVAEATDRQRDAADKLLVSYARAVDPSKETAQLQRDIADQMKRVVDAAKVDVGAQIAAKLLPANQASSTFYTTLVSIRDMFPQLASALDPLIRKIKDELYPTLSTFTSGTADLQFQFHSDGVVNREHGGPVAGDRWYMVGERGPELMRLGAGARGQVYPHDQTRRMLAGGVPQLRAMADGGVIGAGGRQFAQAQVVVVEVEKSVTNEGDFTGPVYVNPADADDFARQMRRKQRQRSLSRGSRNP
jgi:hypothetical protein